jgi:hypothetical protein
MATPQIKKHGDEPTTNGVSYKEGGAPMQSSMFGQGHDNPLESMMHRFNKAADILELEPGIYNYLKTPIKCVIVSIPIVMDDGSMEIFEGYRVVHNDIMGPRKAVFAMLRM